MSRSREVLLPVLQTQRGMIAGHLLEPGNPAYGVGLVVEFSVDDAGPLDAALLVEACRQLYREASALAIRFVVDPDRQWHQVVVDDDVDSVVSMVDMRSETLDRDRVDDHLRQRTAVRLDLVDGALFRADVLVFAADQLAVCLRAHHAVCDGFGGELAVTRLLRLFAALRRAETLPRSPFGSYVDLVAAQRTATDADTDFWVGYLGDLPTRMAFAERSEPPDGVPLTAVTSIASSEMHAPSSPTWWSTIIGLVAVYDAAILDEDEAVLGVPLHNRTTALEQSTPAMLMTELPLRVRVDGAPTMAEMRDRVRRALQTIRPHTLTRPETIRHALPSAWRTGRIHGPTVNVFTRPMTAADRGVTMRSRIVDHGPVQDMSIMVTNTGDTDPQLQISMNPRVYSPDDLARHSERLATWIERCLALADDAPLSAVPILTEAEERAHADLARPPAPEQRRLHVDDPPVWGRPTSVERLLEVAGASGSEGIALLNRSGRPVVFDEVGEVVTADGVRGGVLAALTPDGLMYRGRRDERTLVRGRWVEKGATAARRVSE